MSHFEIKTYSSIDHVIFLKTGCHVRNQSKRNYPLQSNHIFTKDDGVAIKNFIQLRKLEDTARKIGNKEFTYFFRFFPYFKMLLKSFLMFFFQSIVLYLISALTLQTENKHPKLHYKNAFLANNFILA